MAITVDWSLIPFRITIPKSDLTLDTGTKYNLTVDSFWSLLSDFSDSSEAISQPILYSRISATSSTPSITEINLTYYDVQFEDGLYSVNIINGNTNIRDAEVKNQVSVNTNNTTGFIDPIFLEAGLFNNHVSIDVANGVAGTGKTGSGGIIGTRQTPSNNLADAKAIAITRGFTELTIIGSITIGATDVLDDLIVTGLNPSQSTITFIAGCSTSRTQFKQAELIGVLAGALEIENCHIEGLSGIGGASSETNIKNTIIETAGLTLSTVNTQHVHIIDCRTGPPDTTFPPLDFNGTGGDVTIAGFNGQLQIDNMTNNQNMKIFINSGRITINATCTLGAIHIHGDATVVDNSGAGCTVVDQTISTMLAAVPTDVWAKPIESTFTAEELIRLISSAATAKASGHDVLAPVFRDVNDTKNRITATTDANGNRLAVVYDVTP